MEKQSRDGSDKRALKAQNEEKRAEVSAERTWRQSEGGGAILLCRVEEV